VQRVAVRMGWKPSQELLDLVSAGAAENDVAKQKAIYEKYQRILVDNANYITLMQPIYRVAVHKNIKDVKLTPNVWKMELAQIKPAS
jgi:ABC-type transport system substrate-binding protein